MNIKTYILLITFSSTVLLNTVATADTADGMIRVKSTNDVSHTLDKLEKVLRKKGMTIFKRVPHSKAAEKVGLKIRDTELLIFGNPKIGTKLMLCAQTAALDLPLKALAYKDENNQVWLAYNDPQYIAKRHHISDCGKVIAKMTNALAKFTKFATQ